MMRSLHFGTATCWLPLYLLLSHSSWMQLNETDIHFNYVWIYWRRVDSIARTRSVEVALHICSGNDKSMKMKNTKRMEICSVIISLCA